MVASSLVASLPGGEVTGNHFLSTMIANITLLRTIFLHLPQLAMISIEILQYQNTTTAFRNFDSIPGSLEANESDF